jgi:hypothetical protein
MGRSQNKYLAYASQNPIPSMMLRYNAAQASGQAKLTTNHRNDLSNGHIYTCPQLLFTFNKGKKSA